MVIMMVVFVGWMINALAQVTMGFMGLPVEKQFFAGLWFGLLPNGAAACHFFVLYKFR